MNINVLSDNIKKSFGEDGEKWLLSLPETIEKLSLYWSLQDVYAVDNMRWNFVAFAKQKDRPVVLKISCDKNIFQPEFKALKYFNGRGIIKIIDVNEKLKALLLEQASPGHILKEQSQININKKIEIYSAAVNNLCQKTKINFSEYTHVKEWCKAIDKAKESVIEKHIVDKAIKIRSFLFESKPNEYLCHGDLHLENIIQHNKSWIAIDPKGIIGEMAFEAAAFDLISKHELDEPELVETKVFSRISKLSTALEISFNRLLYWIFLRVIISAQWFIEDQGDPSQMLLLAKYLYPLLDKYGEKIND